MTVRELIMALGNMPREAVVDLCVEVENETNAADRDVYADAWRVTLDGQRVIIEGVNSR